MIGVFDSGVGGLSVLSALVDSMPEADFVYFADTAYVPYGSKSDAVIRERVIAIGNELVKRGCRLIVVACNTATVSAVRTLRAEHPDLPVVGIEPGVKPAAAQTQSGKIAVLVTESTARSERLARLIAEHASAVQVFVEPCPGWATHVEQLALDDPALEVDARARLEPLLAAGVDRVVLGCTHYGFLRHVLQPIVAGRAELVDVAAAVARQAQRLHPHAPGRGEIQLLASAAPERLAAALPALGLSHLAARVVRTQPAALAFAVVVSAN
ncbi:MAG: glutamate racemase [Rhodocyclaceae bacterium]|nr:glutamate racemase [Rhodocyclaceae bacterium]